MKASAGEPILDDYVAKFTERRDRYSRMIFAVHSPQGTLTAPKDMPVQVWDGPTISDLVVPLGLGDWVTKRV